MTVNEAIEALEKLQARGAGEVLLRAHDWDGNFGEVTKFEIDAGEAVAYVDLEVG
jgi:imidazole glycerol phosphate synthase subunit HisF